MGFWINAYNSTPVPWSYVLNCLWIVLRMVDNKTVLVARGIA